MLSHPSDHQSNETNEEFIERISYVNLPEFDRQIEEFTKAIDDNNGEINNDMHYGVALYIYCNRNNAAINRISTANRINMLMNRLNRTIYDSMLHAIKNMYESALSFIQ